MLNDGWYYRKIRYPYRLGRWRIGYERRDYLVEVPIVVAWPRIWRADDGQAEQ